MKKPDEVIMVTVSHIARLYPCPAKLADEARGLFGLHLYAICPDCQLVPSGYEFWADNGYRQGGATNDRHELARKLRYLAGKQWRTQTGGIMGYRFRLGSQLVYQG